MTDAPDVAATTTAAPQPGDMFFIDTEGEDIDPLDAFMSNLEHPSENSRPNLAIGKGKRKEPLIFNSDDEKEMDAVGDADDDLLTMAAKRKKKDIPPVDHKKMNYEPFRKNFYSESPELSELTPEEVEELRADLDNIKCRPTDADPEVRSRRVWRRDTEGGSRAKVREANLDSVASLASYYVRA